MGVFLPVKTVSALVNRWYYDQIVFALCLSGYHRKLIISIATIIAGRPKEIQYLAGHATPDLTMRVYAHFDRAGQFAKTAERIRALG